MRILSIDPGHTTGIAIFEDNILQLTMTVPFEGAYTNREFFKCLYMLAMPDIVLVEDLPTTNVDGRTIEIAYAYTNWFKIVGNCEIVRIKPGQWKGLVARVEIPGQHARDAATMAQWYINSMKGK